tara:strand:- start:120 stop:803 length:684 start_codon:yes stop_codon:yes gene_type:complete
MKLIQNEVYVNWNKSFEKIVEKRYPNLDLVRLQKWHFGENSSGKILEYGFGTGSNSIHLIDCGYEFYGIDICSGALNQTKKRILDNFPNLDNFHLSLLSENDDQLPYENNSFDYIVCLSVLSLLGNEKRVKALLSEFKRILKIGGKIIIDINDHDSEFSKGYEMIEENVFITPSSNDSMPFHSYCLKDDESFKNLISEFFHIDDSGFSAHRLFGRRINEWIISATNI